MSVFQSTYVSTATRKFSDNDIRALMRISRKNNRSRDLTGFLIYQDNRFLQVIEGAEGAVRELLTKLELDTRHCNIEVVHERVIPEREFGRWQMGCQILGPDLPEGLSELDDRVRHILRVANPDGASATQLLTEFRDIDQQASAAL